MLGRSADWPGAAAAAKGDFTGVSGGSVEQIAGRVALLAQDASQPLQGFTLELPHPLAGEVQPGGNAFQRLGLVIVQPVTVDDDMPLALVQQAQTSIKVALMP